MNRFDLHIHSDYSDGSYNLKELLKEILATGITTFALTDHDTIAGCNEMKELIPTGIKFIPGIELTCIADDIKCHILGYNCNPNNKTLNDLIEHGKFLRRKKLETRIDYLKEKWRIELTEEELNWLYSRRSVVKTHFANILANRGLGNNNVEIMKKYLDGCKTGNTRLNIEEAINAITESGGIPIWAHPLGGEGEIHLTPEKFLPKLDKMIGYGIKGLECFYSRYSENEANFLTDCASKHHLLISGGSDFHGKNKTGIKLGQLSSDNTFPKNSIISILHKI